MPENNPLWFVLLFSILLIGVPPKARAQDDPDSVPLGDVARSFRKKTVITGSVIDNDNFSKVMQEAEKARAANSSIFSFDPGIASAKPPSPDVMCSLSSSGSKGSVASDPALLNDLPRAELAKLEGPATIDGDSLQVTVHNGSDWVLRDVLIGLTIVRNSNPNGTAAYYVNPNGGYGSGSYGNARMLPAVAGRVDLGQDQSQKQPDMTILLHVTGSAAPSETAVFRTLLNFALFPDQEWHWAIVKAKGIAPQVSTETLMNTFDRNPSSNAGGSASSVGGVDPQTSQEASEKPFPNPSAPLPNLLPLKLPGSSPAPLASAPIR